MTTLSYF